MTLGYRILPAADRDLDEQAGYLAREASLETALRFYDSVAATLQKLAPMPAIGQRWASRNPRLAGLRVWRVEGFENHLVFYRTAHGRDQRYPWAKRGLPGTLRLSILPSALRVPARPSEGASDFSQANFRHARTMAIKNLFERLRKGLAKTARLFNFTAWFKRKVDQSFLDDLESRLIQADVGVAATQRILGRVKDTYGGKEVDENLVGFVKQELKELLRDPRPGTLAFAPSGPTVLLIAGVNGSGKTTSIAKLAQRLKDQGKSILLGACDTFRAAAAEQLAIWANRAGVEIVRGNSGADPASVAHDACDRALARKIDVLIVDTAGRLHTQQHLMRELEKVRSIIARKIPGAPHEVLLVLDATNGQNAIRQAEIFTKSIGCTGVILTKLDGTAKGGVVVAVRQTLDLPVKFVGVGEAIDDLQPFDADTFVESLFA